jgi:dsRNA-specific ribonuclease
VLDNYNYYLNNPEALIDAKLNSIKILGDVFESFVGAIFIDLELDYMATKTIIMKMIK